METTRGWCCEACKRWERASYACCPHLEGAADHGKGPYEHVADERLEEIARCFYALRANEMEATFLARELIHLRGERERLEDALQETQADAKHEVERLSLNVEALESDLRDARSEIRELERPGPSWDLYP